MCKLSMSIGRLQITGLCHSHSVSVKFHTMASFIHADLQVKNAELPVDMFQMMHTLWVLSQLALVNMYWL